MIKIITLESPSFAWNIHPIQLYLLAQNYQISVTELNKALALSSIELSDLSLKINWQQYSAMLAVVEQHAPKKWPLDLAKRLAQPVYGLLSLAIQSCENWRQALQLLVKFKPLMTALFELKITETKHYIIVDVLPELSRDSIIDRMHQVLAIVCHQVFCSISQFERSSLRASGHIKLFLTSSKPSYHDEICDYIGDSVTYNCPTNFLRLDKRLIDEKLLSADPNTARSIATLMTTQLGQLPLASGLLTLLRRAFDRGFYQQSKCANRLNMSVATLKRKLTQANTSFSRELMHYRLTNACHLLAYSSLNIDDIADKLGFQDQSSFRRMFKQQTGQTPLNYRSCNQQ
ncbi:helix-turn-helix domain-containing protein [Endozoicomonas sp. G2_1]|uniref:helix-turn-helix domain-containing protein n=1 Tax=Endozoicomonas sp. G2_1 TaxID=2821091 RepID=UPI001ADCA9D0|nr:AraC family transcriptional regulator [Endozoicomonas sp. G2_1]MBO9491810.1 helix-turn-helix domain-containing protein [Endozoicomonas sp. G2_1]